MQIFYYFCSMKSLLAVILIITNLSLDDIILDIYRAVTEFGEADYEQLQTDLYALHESPIDLNTATSEELEQLYFLSPKQIDDLLLYVNRHPMDSLYELQLIPSLAEYEVRNLLPFVTVNHPQPDAENPLYAKEVFTQASHEVTARVDARNIEDYTNDPVYVQTRYRFDYQRRVTAGVQLRRPAGGQAADLQYGAYIQLKDIGHLHNLVAGNYQASFGQGLVLAPVFHSGKTAYVSSAGMQRQGLRYYSSVDGEGLHGAGATLRWQWGRQTRLDVSALYSMRRANDSTWHHLAGANMTVRHKRMEVQVTAIENIWTDSIRPYRNTAYNTHYFRGYRQAVVGASARYNHGWFDLFGEVAATENRERWGVGTMVGSRFYPADGVSIVALYRYYSPFFDNALGYAFSESSRIGDENGGYIGWDITRWRRWRVSGYADVFYFAGPKYGIAQSGTIGYDVTAEMNYRHDTRFKIYDFRLRVRAKEKGGERLYSARGQFEWQSGGWSLRTTAEGNVGTGYGVTVYQDAAYTFASVPLTLRGRAQFFDAREYANRIYTYEHDVLYGYSMPAVYGLGGRMYVCLRWQVIPQLALYMRVSETLYQAHWASAHNRPCTRTDVHVMLRAKL